MISSQVRPRPGPTRSLLLLSLCAGLALSPLALSSSPALAGPNEGGKLILHAEPSLVASGGGDLCGWSDLNDAKEAVTEVPGNQKAVVFYVMMAFPDFNMPDVAGLEFGIEYTSPQVAPIAWRPCGQYFEADPRWPASDTGIQIIWPQGEPVTDRLAEVCWFACYAYSGNTFKLIQAPPWGSMKGGGYFGDSTVPTETDDIEGYGIMGFGMHGYNPCLTEEPVFGACCDQDGQCMQQTRTVCEGQGMGYTFAGENMDCSPNPCTPGMGACCINGECRSIAWNDCLSNGGTFMGQGSGCVPWPCPPVRSTSWGGLKKKYRN
jgi:hypothetical protein